MSDFLLIHGGSHGAWCWEAVIRKLQRLGHRGHALDLPGCGDDSTPRAEVGFDTCINAIERFIDARELHGFTLVGHSLAGILLPEIAARQRDRIRELVFVAAFVLDAGECALDLVAPQRQPDYRRMAEASPDHSLMHPPDVARERFYSDLDDEAAAVALARLTPQPFAPYLHRARHSAREFAAVSRYLLCEDDRNLPPAACRDYACKLGGELQRLACGHSPMLSQPQALARILAASDQGDD